MTDVADHNLCPRMLWTPVFPHKILQDSPVQCRPDLLDPKGSLSLAFLCVSYSPSVSLSPSDTHSHTHRQPSSWWAIERKGREMASVIFPLLTGAVQRSMSQSPRGEDIKQRKNLSLFIVFYHRELISLFSVCLSSFFLYFSHIPPIHLLSHFPQPLWLHLFFIFHKVRHLTRPFQCVSLSKTHRGQKGKKRQKVGETFWIGEERDGLLFPNLNSRLSDQGDEELRCRQSSHQEIVKILLQTSHNKKTVCQDTWEITLFCFLIVTCS